MSKLKIVRKFNKIKDKYEKDYQNTPWYLNTENCQIEGIIDELNSIKISNIPKGELGCYLNGRIKILNILKEELILNMQEENNP